MDKTYWTGRKRAAMAMARRATSSEARLIHYELAGRYSLRAALGKPFLPAFTGPATEGEQAALRIPRPGRPGSDVPAARGDPGPDPDRPSLTRRDG